MNELTYPCPLCGKPFTEPTSDECGEGDKRGYYCSVECKFEYVHGIPHTTALNKMNKVARRDAKLVRAVVQARKPVIKNWFNYLHDADLYMVYEFVKSAQEPGVKVEFLDEDDLKGKLDDRCAIILYTGEGTKEELAEAYVKEYEK